MAKHRVDVDGQEFVEGEHLDVLERVVVADAPGLFRPAGTPVVGALIAEGDVLGTTDQRGRIVPVVSRFPGRIVGWLVHPGERVRPGQSVAWLRVSDPSPSVLRGPEPHVSGRLERGVCVDGNVRQPRI